MTKKTVPIANQLKLKSMVSPNRINNVLDASVASKLLFGKDHSTKNIVNNIGFGCGCKRVFLCDS